MRVCPRCRSIFSMPVDRCGIDGTAVIETDVDPMVGTRLDRYEILERMGQGAMGCVYRARQSVLSSGSAIKVLYGNLALNQRLIERFRREAQAIGQMKHPNIVEVTDFGQSSDGLTFLVMQLIHGKTLEEAIENELPFSDHRVARIARQVASGLGEAHRRGFVHRDMKPANIMLADADGLEIVKILDFGVVGMIQQAAMQKLTIAGHIVGTPNYMAPEQARSSTVGAAADLYALGVIVYEMLAGHPPFEGLGVAEVLLKQINDDPPPMPDSVSPGLVKLALWLLEKKPENRPINASRVIAEIDRLNLDVASTEQILVSAVRRALPGRPAGELRASDSAETELHSQEALQELVTPHGGVAVSDPRDVGAEPTFAMPIPSHPPEAETEPPPAPTLMLTPSSSDPLVAPPLIAPRVVSRPMTTPEASPTQLDFRQQRRPSIAPAGSGTGPIKSTSALDTMPPQNDVKEFSATERDFHADSGDLNDVLQADTIPSSEQLTPRSLPPPITPSVIAAVVHDTDIRPDPSGRWLMWVVIGLAVGCGLLIAAILKKLYFP